MKIEETFRDTRNHRFGWSFEDARSQSNERILVLLMVAVLGVTAITLLGQAAESQGLERNFQANRTTRARRVLSLFYLGRNVLNRGEDTAFSSHELLSRFDEIKNRIAALESEILSDSEGIPEAPSLFFVKSYRLRTNHVSIHQTTVNLGIFSNIPVALHL